MQDLINELEAHIKSRYDIDEDDEDFSVDVHLFDYGFIDSIGATALIAHVEKTYGLQVTPQDLMLYPMNTVREIAAFIQTKKER